MLINARIVHNWGVDGVPCSQLTNRPTCEPQVVARYGRISVGCERVPCSQPTDQPTCQPQVVARYGYQDVVDHRRPFVAQVRGVGGGGGGGGGG